VPDSDIGGQGGACSFGQPRFPKTLNQQLSARIKKSYTAVWNWETKGTSTAFVPEDGSLRDIVAAFPNVTFEWLRNETGTEPEFDAPAAGAEKLPIVLRKLEDSIRELERMPIIAHYLALVAARDEALAG
jgi:hypothetical protein